MAELFMKMIIPVSILYIIPFIFGLWYVNKEITARKLNTRTAWMVFLFCAPLFANIFFYVIEVKGKPIVSNQSN